MNIVFSHKDETQQIVVAEIIESLNNIDDYSFLSSNEKHKIQQITAEKRKREYISTRMLLSKILPRLNEEISYLENGKPKLLSYNISISHSKNYVCIFLHKTHNVGVDIEEYRETIHRTTQKFMNKNEQLLFTTTKDKILVWCAKEAMFKLCNTTPDLLEGFAVEKKEDNIIGTVFTEKFDKKVNLDYIRNRNFCLVWCIENAK